MAVGCFFPADWKERALTQHDQIVTDSSFTTNKRSAARTKQKEPVKRSLPFFSSYFYKERHFPANRTVALLYLYAHGMVQNGRKIAPRIMYYYRLLFHFKVYHVRTLMKRLENFRQKCSIHHLEKKKVNPKIIISSMKNNDLNLSCTVIQSFNGNIHLF